MALPHLLTTVILGSYKLGSWKSLNSLKGIKKAKGSVIGLIKGKGRV